VTDAASFVGPFVFRGFLATRARRKARKVAGEKRGRVRGQAGRFRSGNVY